MDYRTRNKWFDFTITTKADKRLEFNVGRNKYFHIFADIWVGTFYIGGAIWRQ